MISSTIRAFTCLIILSAVLLLFGCRDTEPEQQTALTVEMPLHLEDHVDTAQIEDSEVPENTTKPVEWRFDEPQPDWKAIVAHKDVELAQVIQAEDALRIVLTQANSPIRPDGKNGSRLGSIYIDLPDWQREDWACVVIRARASRGINSLCLGFNIRERPADSNDPYAFAAWGDHVRPVCDNSVQTYVLQLDEIHGPWKDGPSRQFGFWIDGSFNHPEEGKPDNPATLDILSVSIIPKEANYANVPAGVRMEDRNGVCRRTLYTHAPGRIKYLVQVPENGRLDVGLGALRNKAPVTFEVTVTPEGGEAQSLLEETHNDPGSWAQRSVDLSHLAGQTVTLALGADAERAGTVALWAAPTLTGTRNTGKPNVILYIIDGAGAEYMSVYGYNRRTTPNLERLAAEGAVFEHAYSNSRWTKPSTPSFMTSLYHSVLGGFTSFSDPLPERAVPMAEHFHQAGYQTALFTSNSLAGRASSLDRGVDVLRDTDMYDNPTPSSIVLHMEFFRWREVFPGQPYWVHFQTTDAWVGSKLSPLFAGLYLTPARRAEHLQWKPKVGGWPTLEQFEQTGVDRLEYYDRNQRLYSEAMAQQDHEIGKLVERLKTMGEWENTLLVVASDHGQHESGLVRLDTYPPLGQHTHLRPEHTHIPMIFVWPGHIAGGQRFMQPVSMIDMLPTLLDLAELPLPDVMQGQSLAPLLLGEEGWESRPVILDEFYRHPETGELRGWIEAIDGRWGASLAVNPHVEIAWRKQPAGAGGRGEYADVEGERPAQLLLYDLWNDPFCMTPLNDERPDLVEKYTKFLKAQWKAHQALAQQFTRSEDSSLTPEQLRTLRSLGYIR